MNKGTKFWMVLLLSILAVIPLYGQVGSTVTGKVTDDDGMPIPGVTVVIKGSTVGTVTDIEGRYSLLISEGAGVLVFSFVGMSSEEVPIGNQNQINVTLSEDASDLDEVIVIGYGTQRKATLTGSVASVSTEEIRSSPAINLTNTLSGLLPGLTALNRSGEPGADAAQVLVRGRNTTGDNSPL